eukprot:3349814-Pyramimonas_sp.AAC.1
MFYRNASIYQGGRVPATIFVSRQIGLNTDTVACWLGYLAADAAGAGFVQPGASRAARALRVKGARAAHPVRPAGATRASLLLLAQHPCIYPA